MTESETKRFAFYSEILQKAGGSLEALTKPEKDEMANLLLKWQLEQEGVVKTSLQFNN